MIQKFWLNTNDIFFEQRSSTEKEHEINFYFSITLEKFIQFVRRRNLNFKSPEKSSPHMLFGSKITKKKLSMIIIKDHFEAFENINDLKRNVPLDESTSSPLQCNLK